MILFLILLEKKWSCVDSLPEPMCEVQACVFNDKAFGNTIFFVLFSLY